MVSGMNLSGLRAAALTVPTLAMKGCSGVGETISQHPGMMAGGLAALTAITGLGVVGRFVPSMMWSKATYDLRHTGTVQSSLLFKAAQAMALHAGERDEGKTLAHRAFHFGARLVGGVSLRESHLVNLLPNNDLSKASFNGIQVGPEVAKAILQRKGSLSGAILMGDFSGFDFRNANLDGADLQGADLSGADLTGVVLRRVELDRAILDGAKLEGAMLFNCSIRGTSFKGAQLEGATIKGGYGFYVILEGADLTGARISEISMDEAKLDGVILENARLTDVKLTHSSMKNARLQGATLKDVYVNYTNLEGADLSGVKIENLHVVNATIDEATMAGLNPNQLVTNYPPATHDDSSDDDYDPNPTGTPGNHGIASGGF